MSCGLCRLGPYRAAASGRLLRTDGVAGELKAYSPSTNQLKEDPDALASAEARVHNSLVPGEQAVCDDDAIAGAQSTPPWLRLCP